MLTKRDRTAYYKQLQETQRARVANLKAAMESAGGVEQLGKFVGQNPNFLIALISEKRAIGEKLARKLEFDLGVPQGWLDTRH
jgi:hypothetical protein